METWTRLVCILALIGGVSGLQWSGSDSGPIQVCSGHSIQLLWNFTLDRGERVKHTVWRYQVEGESEGTMATCVDGHFLPAPSFSGRVTQHKDGGIELSCATILESGNYSIVVSVEHKDSSQTLHGKAATVNIVDTPKTQSGEIHVTTKVAAVRDVTTGAWHIHLTCGNFSDLGQPPVNVIWTTPRGEQLDSSGYEDGAFLLALANPVLAGSYSCRIDPALPAAHCLPPHSPLHKTEGVQVDATAARLAVMEAQQREMMDTMAAERREMNNTMAAEKREMMDTMAQMNDTIAQMMDTMAAEKREMMDTIAQMKDTMASVRRETDNRTSLVQEKLEKIQQNSKPVYFHATQRNDILPSRESILIATNISTNQGGGYNSSTGLFTAPVSGTYFFIGTTGFRDMKLGADLSLVKEGVVISRTSAEGRYFRHSVDTSCHGVVDMEAGERVWLQIDSRWMHI